MGQLNHKKNYKIQKKVVSGILGEQYFLPEQNQLKASMQINKASLRNHIQGRIMIRRYNYISTEGISTTLLFLQLIITLYFYHAHCLASITILWK